MNVQQGESRSLYRRRRLGIESLRIRKEYRRTENCGDDHASFKGISVSPGAEEDDRQADEGDGVQKQQAVPAGALDDVAPAGNGEEQQEAEHDVEGHDAVRALVERPDAECVSELFHAQDGPIAGMGFDPADRGGSAIAGALNLVHGVELAHVDQFVFLNLEKKFAGAFPDGAAADDIEPVEARDGGIVGVNERAIAAGGEGDESTFARLAPGLAPSVCPPGGEDQAEAEGACEYNADQPGRGAAEEPNGA